MGMACWWGLENTEEREGKVPLPHFCSTSTNSSISLRDFPLQRSTLVPLFPCAQRSLPTCLRDECCGSKRLGAVFWNHKLCMGQHPKISPPPTCCSTRWLTSGHATVSQLLQACAEKLPIEENTELGAHEKSVLLHANNSALKSSEPRMNSKLLYFNSCKEEKLLETLV